MTSQSLSLKTDIVKGVHRDNTEGLLPSHAWQSTQMAACWKWVEAIRAIRNSASWYRRDMDPMGSVSF